MGTFIEENSLVLRVLLTFIVTAGLLLALLLFFTPVIEPIANYLTAQALSSILWLLGADGLARGTLVTSTVFGAHIIFGCTAVLPSIVFIAAVIAFPIRVKWRMLGIGLGVPVILIVNQIRLVTLFYIGFLYPQAFDTAHIVIWQALMIFFAVLLWLFWAAKVPSPIESTSHA